jgi:tryptophan 2,3-dioxygenase
MAEALKKRLAEGDVKEAFYVLLGKLGFKIPKDAASLERKNDEPAIAQVLDVLRSIYQDPEKNLPLYMLTEGLLELDEQLGYWRSHHAVVVERVIGRKRGTGGSSGVDYLRSTLGKRIFPLLWEARTLLTKRS